MLFVRDLLECFGKTKIFHIYAMQNGCPVQIYCGSKEVMPAYYKGLQVDEWDNNKKSKAVEVKVLAGTAKIK